MSTKPGVQPDLSLCTRGIKYLREEIVTGKSNYGIPARSLPASGSFANLTFFHCAKKYEPSAPQRALKLVWGTPTSKLLMLNANGNHRITKSGLTTMEPW